jgi:hypothetical protein
LKKKRREHKKHKKENEILILMNVMGGIRKKEDRE